MKTTRVLHLLIVLLFIAALALPLVFADFVGGKISATENRYLANFPEIIKDGKLAFHPSEFDQWINDNVGGRELATKLNTIANFRLFGLSARDDVLLGKDNWTFYYTQDILDDFTGNNLLSDDQLNKLTDDFQAIQQYLFEKNIPLLIAIAPDKKTVYPEYYPNGIRAASGLRRTQQIVNHLINIGGVSIFTMEDTLVANKNVGTIYSPRVDNAHWNYLGGYIGYESIIDHLFNMGIGVSCIPLEMCDITVSEYQSLFNDALPISETWYTISNQKSDTIHLQREHMDNFPFLSFNKDPDNYKRYYINDDQSLPSLLFIGDSYSQKLFEFIPQSFSRVMFIHTADMAKLPQILEAESFDAIVIEFAERMFYYEQMMLSACHDSIIQEEKQKEMAIKIIATPTTEFDSWGYHFTDYLGTTPSNGNVLTVNSGDATSYMEGWAIDPLAGAAASGVVIQVGDQYYAADYGKERDSVSTYFQNEAYLHSGYTINLNTQELVAAGRLTVHVLSADGTYQYPPCIYIIQVQ